MNPYNIGGEHYRNAQGHRQAGLQHFEAYAPSDEELLVALAVIAVVAVTAGLAAPALAGAKGGLAAGKAIGVASKGGVAGKGALTQALTGGTVPKAVLVKSAALAPAGAGLGVQGAAVLAGAAASVAAQGTGSGPTHDISFDQAAHLHRQLPAEVATPEVARALQASPWLRGVAAAALQNAAAGANVALSALSGRRGPELRQGVSAVVGGQGQALQRLAARAARVNPHSRLPQKGMWQNSVGILIPTVESGIYTEAGRYLGTADWVGEDV
jgi:hypothetical protein